MRLQRLALHRPLVDVGQVAALDEPVEPVRADTSLADAVRTTASVSISHEVRLRARP